MISQCCTERHRSLHNHHALYRSSLSQIGEVYKDLSFWLSLFQNSCYGLIVSLSLNSYVVVLTLNVTVFEDRACKEVTKIKWDHSDGDLIWIISVCIGRDTKELSPSLFISLSLPPHHVKTQWEICYLQARMRPSQEWNWPASWSWTSQLQNCETINCCCLSHPA